MTNIASYARVGYFYAGWSATAYLAKIEQGIWAMAISLGAILLLFLQKKLSDQQGRSILLFSLAMAFVGFLLDTILHMANVVHFKNENELKLLNMPIWMLSVWVLFASVLPTIAKPFYSKPRLGSLMSAFSGPLSYLLAERMGILVFKDSLTLVVYGLFWMIFFYVAIMGLRNIEVKGSLLND